MKYLLISILIFTVTNCFAVDQKLIDAKEQYFVAELDLPEIEKEMIDTKQKLENALWWLKWEEAKADKFRIESSIKRYRTEVEEKQSLLHALITQQIETKKTLQKLEPLKDDYYRQSKIEREHENLIELIMVIIIISTLIAIFGSVVWLIITQQKKYQQLLKAGKITQAEYDRIMSSSHEKSTLFRDDDRTNPATGLRMTGGCDSGGNPYGCSFRDSSSENHRTKWD